MKFFILFHLLLNSILTFRIYDAGYDNDIYKPKERYVRIGHESSLHHYKNLYGKVKKEIDFINNLKD